MTTADFPGDVVQETVVDTPAGAPAAESPDSKQYDLGERKPDEGYLDFKERMDRKDASRVARSLPTPGLRRKRQHGAAGTSNGSAN